MSNGQTCWKRCQFAERVETSAHLAFPAEPRNQIIFQARSHGIVAPQAKILTKARKFPQSPEPLLCIATFHPMAFRNWSLGEEAFLVSQYLNQLNHTDLDQGSQPMTDSLKRTRTETLRLTCMSVLNS